MNSSAPRDPSPRPSPLLKGRGRQTPQWSRALRATAAVGCIFSLSPSEGERAGERGPLWSIVASDSRGRVPHSCLVSRVVHRRARRLSSKLLRFWRPVTMILLFPHYRHAAHPPMQSLPNFQQYPLAICPPPMIPESQFLNSLGFQQLLPRLIALYLCGQPMLVTIQLNREPSERTIKIKVISSHRVLSAKLKSGEPPCPQRLPQLLFFIGLIPTETAGSGAGVHGKQNKAGSPEDKLGPPLP